MGASSVGVRDRGLLARRVASVRGCDRPCVPGHAISPHHERIEVGCEERGHHGHVAGVDGAAVDGDGMGEKVDRHRTTLPDELLADHQQQEQPKLVVLVADVGSLPQHRDERPTPLGIRQLGDERPMDKRDARRRPLPARHGAASSVARSGCPG